MTNPAKRGFGHVRRLLVIAPHPDDEAVAAWALMRRLRARGATVEVLVVSDGGASHPGSQRWPRPRLVAERRRETRRVLRPIGITPLAIRFLGLPDGGLGAPASRLPHALRRALLSRRAPDLIIAPIAEDAHEDHAAVARALRAVPRRGEARAVYHVWPAGAGRRLRGPHLPLAVSQVPMKRAAIRRYRTQAGLITDATAGFTITHRHLAAFAAPRERFGWDA